VKGRRGLRTHQAERYAVFRGQAQFQYKSPSQPGIPPNHHWFLPRRQRVLQRCWYHCHRKTIDGSVGSHASHCAYRSRRYRIGHRDAASAQLHGAAIVVHLGILVAESTRFARYFAGRAIVSLATKASNFIIAGNVFFLQQTREAWVLWLIGQSLTLLRDHHLRTVFLLMSYDSANFASEADNRCISFLTAYLVVAHRYKPWLIRCCSHGAKSP